MIAAASPAWTVLAWALLLICFFFMPPPHPNAGLTPVNINYVLGTERRLRRRPGFRPYVWLAGLMIGLPVLLYWPVASSAVALRTEACMTIAVAAHISAVSSAALCAARDARRLARLSCVHRLHRARRHGDRRRRLVRAQPRRRTRARGPRHPRRRCGVLADPARGDRGRTRASSTAHGRVSVAATHAGDGARRRRPTARWSRSRRSMAPIRCTARVALEPDMPLAARWRSATARSAPPSIRRCWRGSISKPGARLTIGARDDRDRAVLKSEPDKLAGGIGFGPRLIISEAALRATGLMPARQPGALASTGCGCRTAATAPRDAVIAASEAQLPDAGWEVRTRANASPALGRNIERFTQYLTLVGLTALLVGGVGVANAVKHYHRPPPRRDRHAEIARRDRRPGVRDLSDRGDAARRGRHRDRARVGAILPFAIAGAFGASCRCRSCRRCIRANCRSRALWLSHRARLRALAARPRA